MIEYKICIHSSAKSTECFESPCANGQIYTSSCTDYSQVNVSLNVKGDEIENGTHVTMFCLNRHCRSYTNTLSITISKLIFAKMHYYIPVSTET